jgi:hypothetical protein
MKATDKGVLMKHKDRRHLHPHEGSSHMADLSIGPAHTTTLDPDPYPERNYKPTTWELKEREKSKRALKRSRQIMMDNYSEALRKRNKNGR